MNGVTVIDHPLVQHKLTLLRDKTRSTKVFRELFNEIGALLFYEVTRDLPLEMVEVETPLATMKSPKLSGKKLVLAPVGRAGNGFLDGMLTLVPSARVAHVGVYRDPRTLVAVDAEKLGSALKWEVSRGGALFPHLYGDLPFSAVAWIKPLPLRDDAHHDFSGLPR